MPTLLIRESDRLSAHSSARRDRVMKNIKPLAERFSTPTRIKQQEQLELALSLTTLLKLLKQQLKNPKQVRPGEKKACSDEENT